MIQDAEDVHVCVKWTTPEEVNALRSAAVEHILTYISAQD